MLKDGSQRIIRRNCTFRMKGRCECWWVERPKQIDPSEASEWVGMPWIITLSLNEKYESVVLFDRLNGWWWHHIRSHRFTAVIQTSNRVWQENILQ
jgi:hypothetical protein